MNDFTKDELKRLYSITNLFDGEAIKPLRNKIFSLIQKSSESLNNYEKLYCQVCEKNKNN